MLLTPNLAWQLPCLCQYVANQAVFMSFKGSSCSHPKNPSQPPHVLSFCIQVAACRSTPLVHTLAWQLPCSCPQKDLAPDTQIVVL
jgi:hypothetical protein